jgi:DNA end-binding protein Ku
VPDEDFELDESGAAPHSIWSGAITFGLLSLPVDLFPSSRPRAVPLKLVDAEHHPLKRRYFCPAHERFLDRDEIVRGYEVEADRFVIVTDEELESISPESSRAIDLRTFVQARDIDPIYFRRSYLLMPGEGGTRAYRLLAETMERSGRVGVATFVMRGKEYLVALLSEGGILRAETLRFEDELRSPGEVGLEAGGRAPKPRVKALASAIEALAADTLGRDALEDRRTERLRALIERKLVDGIDVEQAPEPEQVEGEAQIIDLMEVLRRRLQPETESAAPQAAKPGKAKRRGRAEPLDRLGKEALYERAKALRVPGRSKMDKQQLIDALSKAEG